MCEREEGRQRVSRGIKQINELYIIVNQIDMDKKKKGRKRKVLKLESA